MLGNKNHVSRSRKEENNAVVVEAHPPESALLFRRADFDSVMDNNGDRLKAIMEKGRKVENETVEPYLTTRLKMMSVVLDFVRRQQCIVYGGYAINTHIGRANPADQFYDFSKEAPDIEFYSTNAVLDARALCDEFHKLGYPYIRSTEAMHAQTYRVTVDLVQVCDITYVPKNVEKLIPYEILAADGIRYAHPHFLLIDSLRILTDPVGSFWRLDKALPRIYKLQEKYPFLKPPNHEARLSMMSGSVDSVDSVIQTAVRFLQQQPDTSASASTILIGCAAFQRFCAWYNGVPQQQLHVPILEVIFTEYSVTMPALFNYLRSLYGKAVEYEEYQSFFDYTGHRGYIYMNGRLAICAFHHNHRCTPVLPLMRDDPVERETLRTGTFSLVVLYLLITRLLCHGHSPPDHSRAQLCDSMVYEMLRMRTDFIDRRAATIVQDDHVFHEFTTNCIGKPVSVLRLHKEETEYRRAHLYMFGMAYFSYDPSNNNKQMAQNNAAVDAVANNNNNNNNAYIEKYKYMNTSGNVIRHDKDRLFTPSEGLRPLNITARNSPPGGKRMKLKKKK